MTITDAETVESEFASPTSNKRLTSFERLGGRDAVETIVDAFYKKATADPMLSGFFAGSDLEHLKQMQREYVTIALGGPSTLSSTGLRDTHAGHGIRSQHFLRFLDLFMETIQGQGLDDVELDAVFDRMAIAATDVLDSPTETG
jgi:hemoglobin